MDALAVSRRAVAFSVAFAFALGACRDCDAPPPAPAPATSSHGPRMPAGMLAPAASAGPTGSTTPLGSAALEVARGVRSGPWVELQIAPASDTASRSSFDRWKDDSRFVSIEAITLLHGPFARALPGFDLFVPRLFAAAAATKLANELEAFAAELDGVTTASAAREKWGAQSELVHALADDAAWTRTRGTLAATARELAGFAKAASAKGGGVWVLGPS